MKKLVKLSLTAALAMIVAGGIVAEDVPPAAKDKDPMAEGESAWRAKPERPAENARRRRAEAPGEAAPGPQMRGERAERQMGPFMERAQQLRREAKRLTDDSARIDKQAARIAEMEVSDERRQRLERMVTLKRELLELERAEFVDTVTENLGKASGELAERLKEVEEDSPRAAAMRRMAETIDEVRGGEQTFEALSSRILALPDLSPRGPEDRPNPQASRTARLEEELEFLQKRIERLREEMMMLGSDPAGGGPMGEHPMDEMSPDERALYHRGNMPPGRFQEDGRPRPARRPAPPEGEKAPPKDKPEGEPKR